MAADSIYANNANRSSAQNMGYPHPLCKGRAAKDAFEVRQKLNSQKSKPFGLKDFGSATLLALKDKGQKQEDWKYCGFFFWNTYGKYTDDRKIRNKTAKKHDMIFTHRIRRGHQTSSERHVCRIESM